MLRWYQEEAVAAVWRWLIGEQGNPIVVAPTGSGKSWIIAQLCREAVEQYGGRVMVVQHRKELIQQNAEKIRHLLPGLDVGIYSAGLNSRDTDAAVVCGGIQSVYKRAMEFGQRHLIIADEAHLVPLAGEGMYKQFFADIRTANPKSRAVGTTATPFRLDCGPLCRPDGIFQKVCYSVPIQRLIAEGFLTNLTTKTACKSADTSGLHIRGGEFVPGEAEMLFNRRELVEAACGEIVAKARGRQSVLIFCSGVNHARHVAEVVERLTGEPCGLVTGESLPLEREATLTAFRERRLRWLCNIDVLTTGFDAPCIDAIAILRATMSAGLFAQMVGRGFRIYEDKADCVVLDFGGNLQRHGPIDSPEYGRTRQSGSHPGEAPTKTCPNCGQEVHASTRECECGYAWPPPEERHGTDADQESQILAAPQTWIVEGVAYSKHVKRNAKPDDKPTLRVVYSCRPEDGTGGNLEGREISEWVCIEHDGYAGRKAFRWWDTRSFAAYPDCVERAEQLARCGAVAWPRKITTKRDGRWDRVIAYDLEPKPEDWYEEVDDGFGDDLPF